VGSTRGASLICPVCEGAFKNVWWHLCKRCDPAHTEAVQAFQQEALALFDSDLTAPQVAEAFPFGDEVVLSLWREAHGPKALRTRSGRLQSKERLPCENCGELINVWAKRFCSPACANAMSASNLEANHKRSEALRGRKRPHHVREAISNALKAKAEDGTLPVMHPEVRAKQSATKRRQAEAGLLTENARAANAALNDDPIARARRDAAWAATIQERYGVSHLYMSVSTLEVTSPWMDSPVLMRLRMWVDEMLGNVGLS
jgi:hypothetical protein